MTIKISDYLKTEGNREAFNKMLESTEQKLVLRSERLHEEKQYLRSLINEQYQALIKEVKQRDQRIDKKIEEMRKEMFKEYFKRAKVGSTFTETLEKRIDMQTVCNLIEEERNHVVLFFLNKIKAKNEPCLYEYHLGHVYFRAF